MVAACLGGAKRFGQNGNAMRASHLALLAVESKARNYQQVGSREEEKESNAAVACAEERIGCRAMSGPGGLLYAGPFGCDRTRISYQLVDDASTAVFAFFYSKLVAEHAPWKACGQTLAGQSDVTSIRQTPSRRPTVKANERPR